MSFKWSLIIPANFAFNLLKNVLMMLNHFEQNLEKFK